MKLTMIYRKTLMTKIKHFETFSLGLRLKLKVLPLLCDIVPKLCRLNATPKCQYEFDTYFQVGGQIGANRFYGTYLFSFVDRETEVFQYQVETRAVTAAVVLKLNHPTVWPVSSRLGLLYLPGFLKSENRYTFFFFFFFYNFFL